VILSRGPLLSNILIVFFDIWLLYRFLLSPLVKITRNIDQMNDNKTNVHIEATGLREFQHLAMAFNNMFETVRSHTHQLEILSLTDGLTNIANRRSFDETLNREWRICNREHLAVSLLYIDIDLLKNYNDYYGHQSGDDGLKKIARIIDQNARRPTDLAARYGGEEFVLLLSNTDSESATRVAKNLIHEVNQARYPHEKSDVTNHITLSIGIATLIPSDKISHEHLIKLADKALYRAKHEGRNRITIA